MTSKELLQKFYDSFSQRNAEGMNECYHQECQFQDPVFGYLFADKVKMMWSMLMSNKDSDLKISYEIVEASETKGRVNWRAEYSYGPKKRKVVNLVQSEFTFKDSLIFKQKDTFNLWKWSSQALGFIGYTLGWTSYLQNRIQTIVNRRLVKYMEKNS